MPSESTSAALRAAIIIGATSLATMSGFAPWEYLASLTCERRRKNSD